MAGTAAEPDQPRLFDLIKGTAALWAIQAGRLAHLFEQPPIIDADNALSHAVLDRHQGARLLD